MLSVVRAYCVEISTKEERTAIMAIQTATQYFGFAVMPILGGAFSSLGTIQFSFVDIDSESMPSFIMALICAFTIMGVVFMQEPVNRNTSAVIIINTETGSPNDQTNRFHNIAFVVFFALNMLSRMALSVMETLGGVLFEQVYPTSGALGTGV